MVSPDNPYLAANLLLQQESKSSEELAGFLETKGLPSALSVNQDFFSPANLKFFYRENSEQYNLELLQGIWVIKGPSPISDPGAQALLETSASAQVTALSPTKEKSKAHTEVKTESYEAKVEPKSNQELIPLFEDGSSGPGSSGNGEPLAKHSKKTQIVIPAEPVQDEVSNTASAKAPNSSPIDDLISQFASSPAETTPRGDVVHYITSEKETLEKISKWYTKTHLTLSRIARANKLEATATLSPGDQVVIPSELVKNKMRLPEEAVDSL